MGGERAACTSSFFASPMECFFGSLKRWRWAALVGTHGILDEGQQEWCGWGATWWDRKYFITASFPSKGPSAASKDSCLSNIKRRWRYPHLVRPVPLLLPFRFALAMPFVPPHALSILHAAPLLL